MSQIHLTQNQLLERLSQEAKTSMMKLGAQWLINTKSSSTYWVDRKWMKILLTMPEHITINKIYKLTGGGLHAIRMIMIDNFIRAGIIDVFDDGRYKRYTMTEPGKEVVNVLMFTCQECDNVGCTYCNEWYETP